jgi:sialate O-acetylesterase
MLANKKILILKEHMLFFFLMAISMNSFATITPHHIFSDNMVLQRDMRVPVWGFATKDEKVLVRFNGQEKITYAKHGKWIVYLQPMKAVSVGQSMTIKGAENEIIIQNILIGEVWLCAGQSNMEWALFKTNGGEAAIANSSNPMLRIFNVPHNVQMQPVHDINAQWVLSAPKTTRNISAVGYYFLSKLQQKLNVPIGFINASFGGTKVEAWLSREVLMNQPIRDRYMDPDLMKQEYDSIWKNALPLINAYEKEKEIAKNLNQPIPPKPSNIPGEYKGTTTIYNGELYPLIPFAIKGIAWYQGESNGYPQLAGTYAQLLKTLIISWRKVWKQATLPFIVIQLSGDAKEVQSQPSEISGKAMIKEAQLVVANSLKNVALVTTSDCGDLDVHYHEKKPIGDRVCNAALSLAYQQSIEYTGPLFNKYKIVQDSMFIYFTHAQNGLMIKTDSVKPAHLYGFAIAGVDKKFYWANAYIEGNKVVVTHPGVPKPVAVRYAWADFSYQWNLFNRSGFPASTFRTDRWDLETPK